MRSLTLKVIIAFVIVGLVQALLVAYLVRNSTRQSFDQFVEEEALRIFIEEVDAYYEMYGSLDGLAAYLPGRRSNPPPPQGNRAGPPPPQGNRGGPPPLQENRAASSQRRPRQGAGENEPRRRPPRMGPRYGFADSTGLVYASNGEYRVGEVLTAEEKLKGQLIRLNEEVSGIILLPVEEAEVNPEARRYLANTDKALGIALGGGFVVALILGGIFARSYMKPLRELTMATLKLSKGSIHKPVIVRTRDEIGALTASFNQMGAELDRANHSRKQLTADIAHELRSPLSILTGYLEAIQNGDLEPSTERIATMFTEAKHLERLISDLHLLALADAGELPLSPELTSINQLLVQVQESFAQSAQEADISIQMALDEEEIHVLIDQVRFKQVISNLVRNALRFAKGGGAIQLSATKARDHIEIKVADTGAGIPQEQLAFIFNRFYKADASRTNHHESSGLGLAIVKSIVEAHQGSIRVDSEVGQGTTFTISLPVSV